MGERPSAPLSSGNLTTSGLLGKNEHTSGSLKTRHPSTPLRGRNSKGNEDLVQKMKQLKEMLEIGLITDDEFAEKKAELLARL
jgi:hypothetical protein